MTALFDPLLTAALLSFPGCAAAGSVVDDQGKPVDSAQLVFLALASREHDTKPLKDLKQAYANESTRPRQLVVRSASF
jgi:hypothetical protein